MGKNSGTATAPDPDVLQSFVEGIDIFFRDLREPGKTAGLLRLLCFLTFAPRGGFLQFLDQQAPDLVVIEAGHDFVDFRLVEVFRDFRQGLVWICPCVLPEPLGEKSIIMSLSLAASAWLSKKRPTTTAKTTRNVTIILRH